MTVHISDLETDQIIMITIVTGVNESVDGYDYLIYLNILTIIQPFFNHSPCSFSIKPFTKHSTIILVNITKYIQIFDHYDHYFGHEYTIQSIIQPLFPRQTLQLRWSSTICTASVTAALPTSCASSTWRSPRPGSPWMWRLGEARGSPWGSGWSQGGWWC